MATKTYAVNYRAQETRQHGTPNRMRFMADDAGPDTAAAAIAVILQGLTSAQQTSLVKRIHADPSLGGSHTTGTGYSAHARAADAVGAFQTWVVRNFKGATVADAAITACFGGTADGPSGVSALGTLPAVVGSGLVIDHMVNGFAVKRH